MTNPRDKAKELVSKFIHVVSTNGSLSNIESRREQNAKYCALIAAQIGYDENERHSDIDGMNHWNEIKTEIQSI